MRNDERLSASINLFHILKQRQSSNLDKTLRTDYRYEARIFVNDESAGQRSFTMEELGDLKSTIFTPAICISPHTRVIGLQVCETESRPSGRQVRKVLEEESAYLGQVTLTRWSLALNHVPL